MATLLTLLAILGGSPMPARVTPKIGVPRPQRASESCLVEAPSTYVAEARRWWCGDGRVAGVTLRTDTRNYIVQLDLSEAGESAWRASATEAMARFKKIVDEAAKSLRMNVAVTIRNNRGARLAICSRDLVSRAATCATR